MMIVFLLLAFLGTGIALAIALALLLVMASGIIGDYYGAPYLRSSKHRIAAMVASANITPGVRVVDLGSGDGSILLAAARLGALATGVEVNPFLCLYTRMRARLSGMEALVRVVTGNLNTFSLQNADIIFTYLLPPLMHKVAKKFASEAPAGSLLISNSFPLPGWTPIKTTGEILIYQKES